MGILLVAPTRAVLIVDGRYITAARERAGSSQELQWIQVELASRSLEERLLEQALSDRAPVWGDIYVKGGQGYAFNAGLTNHGSDNVNLFVARPDTVIGRVGSETPEPSTMVMLGSGLALAAWIRRRKVSSLS